MQDHSFVCIRIGFTLVFILVSKLESLACRIFVFTRLSVQQKRLGWIATKSMITNFELWTNQAVGQTSSSLAIRIHSFGQSDLSVHANVQRSNYEIETNKLAHMRFWASVRTSPGCVYSRASRSWSRAPLIRSSMDWSGGRILASKNTLNNHRSHTHVEVQVFC